MVDLILSSAAIQVTLLWLYHRRASLGFGAKARTEEENLVRTRKEGDELECVKAALRGQRPAYEGMAAFDRWLAAISARTKFMEQRMEGLHALMGVERELVELTLQGMTPKEIAQFKGVSGFHIYNVRSRVRKKLGVPGDMDLGDFLKGNQTSVNQPLTPPLKKDRDEWGFGNHID